MKFETKTSELKRETFVDDEGKDCIQITKKIETPRQTFIKGDITGKDTDVIAALSDFAEKIDPKTEMRAFLTQLSSNKVNSLAGELGDDVENVFASILKQNAGGSDEILRTLLIGINRMSAAVTEMPKLIDELERDATTESTQEMMRVMNPMILEATNTNEGFIKTQDQSTSVTVSTAEQALKVANEQLIATNKMIEILTAQAAEAKKTVSAIIASGEHDAEGK
jgi:hypothetical protein